MSSLIDKLKEKEQGRNKEYSVLFWKPEPDEIVEGIVEEMGETITPNGDAEYVQIMTDEGKKFMVFVNSILQKLIVQEDVKVGDRIAIKFLGLVQAKKTNRKFKDYVLVKDDSEEN
ncbi:MAG: hypothetical protein AB1325_14105 [Nitrospirota bacterium]